jgi:hypothetical protein
MSFLIPFALLAGCSQVQVSKNPQPVVAPPSTPHPEPGTTPARPPPPKGPPAATLYWVLPLDFTDGTPIEEGDNLATNIYQGPASQEVLVALAAPGTTWSAPADTLVPGTTVCWVVRAVVGASLQSEPSNEVCKSF